MSMKMGGGSAPAGNFELCPPGPQQLVCCDVLDHGIVDTPTFSGGPPKKLHKITIRWMSSHRMMDGKPYMVQKRYTLSSHSKSTLRQDLEKWRGKPFADAQAAAFDVDRLIGVNCFAQVIHKSKPRGIFAEVVTLMPALPNLPKLIVDPSYIRMRDRPPEQPAQPAARPAQPQAPVSDFPDAVPVAEDPFQVAPDDDGADEPFS
jgi:hypothetical protein